MLSWEVRKNSLGTRKDDVLKTYLCYFRPTSLLQTTFSSQCIGFFSLSLGHLGLAKQGWEILVDGKNCPSGKMLQDFHSEKHNNPHSTMAFGKKTLTPRLFLGKKD